MKPKSRSIRIPLYIYFISDGTETYLGLKGSYWLSLKGYNPAEVARNLNYQNMLIVQGGHDYQVDEAIIKYGRLFAT
jgi:hypothetical protein